MEDVSNETEQTSETGCDSLVVSSPKIIYPHRIRRTLAQVLATIAESLLVLDLGMMIAVPTIVIGELHNAKNGLSLDDNQASWFGSILLLCQPLGSVLSGCLQAPLGRKKTMLLVNIPLGVSWYLLYSAQTVDTLYAASVTMGIGIGFLEAPMLAYIGEISEPRLRGRLAAYANSNTVIGHLLEFILRFLFPWRNAMYYSCVVPIITVISISLIPESPVWLLTRGRRDEAMSALRWLRGWVSAEDVSDEFHDLELYCDASKDEYNTMWEAKLRKSAGYTGVPDSEYGTRPQRKPGFVDGIKDLLRPGILIPLRLITTYFFFFHAGSLTAMRAYMIEVFARLEVPLSPNVLTVMSAAFQGAGTVTCICLVHMLGKRTLSLVSMTSCATCCLLLGVYTYATFWYSLPMIPLMLFCTLYFSMNLGIAPVPWLLISEMFPTRGRGVAGGVCAASFYVIAFLVSKTWVNLINIVDLHGCFLFYGLLASVGIVFVYYCVPETEGKTLAEIETQISKKNEEN